MCRALSLKSFIFCVCACVNYSIILSFMISMNALFTDWLTYFQANRGATSAVQSTLFGVTIGAGLLGGLLMKRMGNRRCLLLGSGLSALGLLSGSYAPTLPILIFCVGVVTGSGFCLVHMCTLLVILRRFPERAGFISCIISAVCGLFDLGTPILYRYLSEQYTWRGSLLLASAIILHSFIFDLLLTSPILNQPTPSPSKNPPSDNEEPVLNMCATAADAGFSEMEPTNVVEGVPTTTDQFQRVSSISKVNLDPPSIPRRCCGTIEMNEVPGRPTGELKLLKIVSPDACDTGPREARVRCSSSDGDGGDDVAKTGGTVVVAAKETPPADRPGDRGCSSDFIMEQTSVLPSEQPCSQIAEYVVRRSTTRDQLRESDASQLERSPYFSQSGNGRRGTFSERFRANCLTSPLYVCVLLSSVTIVSTIFCFILLVLDFAVHKGWTVQDGVLLNFVFMLSSLSSRALVGVVSLHRRVSNTAMLIGCEVVGSVGLCFVGQVELLSLAAVCYACMGVGFGVTVGIYPAAVLDIMGPKVYPLSLGLVCTAEGIMDTVMGILTGVLVDMLQSYSIVSLVYGLTCLALSILLLVVFLTCR